jgi:uncharacterized pyridoxal phosphate-containing UPF0001 family protein
MPYQPMLARHYSFIGHLQSNKAKFVARFADEFQAPDSFHTA